MSLTSLPLVRGCYVCREKAWVGTPYAHLLATVDLGHDEIAHYGYTSLLKAGISCSNELSRLDDSSILNLPGIGVATLARIREVVPKPPYTGPPPVLNWWALQAEAEHVRKDRASYEPEFARALADAMTEAAAEIERVERHNAKNPGDLPELISPTAEALARVAWICREYRFQ